MHNVEFGNTKLKHGTIGYIDIKGGDGLPFIFFGFLLKLSRMIKLFNTLTRKVEEFKPIRKGRVGLYTCGPTVYNYAHIGNLRTYIFEDILKRSLEYNGLKVKHVMNITDVGHLASDADDGEDKMMRALRREGLSPSWDSLNKLASQYTDEFKANLKDLNIREPDVWCNATKHIKEMIAMNKLIEKAGFTYMTSDGLYFNTSKLHDYGRLARLDIKGLKAGARTGLRGKKNPTDFTLWIKAIGEHKNHIMQWDSPWGKGFPGWHIECSAMSRKYLGETFDIHCGGEDHIAIHHPNEIAQAEAASGKQFVNWWMHGSFLQMGTQKMAKSAGAFVILKDVLEEGVSPLSYRYLCLTAHYRAKLEFSWRSLDAADTALKNLYERIRELDKPKGTNKEYELRFLEVVNNDLNMPAAIALVWELIKDKVVESGAKASLLYKFDEVLGLQFKEAKEKKAHVSKDAKDLAKKREIARKDENWAEADKIRKEIEVLGYSVEDTSKGPKLKKKE